jgi:hypothetical protein
VALAAGDATTLAAPRTPIGTPGNAVDFKSQFEVCWACMPYVNAFVRLGLTAYNQDINVKVCSRGLIMDLIFMQKSQDIRAPDLRYMELAITALHLHDDLRADVRPRNTANKFKLECRTIYLENQALQQRHLAQTVACMLQGGPEWAFDCAIRPKRDAFNPTLFLKLASALVSAVSMLQSQSPNQSAALLVKSIQDSQGGIQP